jgi:hypothetical protein
MSAIATVPEIEAIQKAWEKHILNLKPARQHNDEDEARDYFYAGSWRPCLRRMVLEATHPSYFPDVDVDTKARFIRGEQREIDLRQALERAGQLSMPAFTVEGQQERIFLRDRKNRKVISGKKDCSIRWESGTRWSTEFKSWSTFLTDNIQVFADLLKSPYTQGGAKQLLAYLYAKDEPFGLLVLDRPGIPRLIPVPLEDHIGLMEDFLTDAECGRDHIEAETLPDYVDEPDECRRCPVFGSYCNPPLNYDGAAIITEDTVLAQIEHHEALKPAHKDYDQTHDDLADYLKRMTPKEFKGKNKKQIIAGPFFIEACWQKLTTLDMPEEEKKKYQKSDDAGKFSFKISRVA